MTTKQMIEDLETLKQYFTEQTGSYPICLDFAIKKINKSKNKRQKAKWCDRSYMSCGNILRTRSDVVEYKCLHCGRWTQWWYGTCKNEYCSHCGYKMTNDSNTIKDFER